MRLILLTLAAVVVFFAATCFFVVDETEYVVVKRFGDPVATLIEPGLNFKWPWPVDTLARFDNRLMVLENPGPDEPDKEYLTHDEQSDIIGKNVVVTTYTCWRIQRDKDAVLTFLQTVGNRQTAEARLGDVVVSELGSTLGENDFSLLISTDPERRRWDELLGNIRKNCRERVADAYGIDIVDIRIQRLNFPPQNRRNVFDRMRAERETIAARYRSEGEEKATGIRARANRERDEIIATAEMQAEQIRGRADAEAARTYADAYSRDPEFYSFLRTLETYEKTFDEKTVAILSAGSEFLQLLNRSASTLSVPDASPAADDATEAPSAAPAPVPAPEDEPTDPLE